MDRSGLHDIYTRSQRATSPMAEGVYIRQTTSAHVITTIVTLPGMNHAWASAKQLDPYSEMKLQYLYFHLLYSILGLKCNIYITL